MSTRQTLIPNYQNKYYGLWPLAQQLIHLLDYLKYNKNWIGWALAFAAIIAYSTSAPIGRAIIGVGMNPTEILVGRYLIATSLLGLTLGLTVKGGLRMDRRGLMFCLIGGGINGVTTLAFFWALTRISASLASMLVSLYPLIVLGLLALRGEKFTYRNTIRLVLGLGGIYFIVGPGGAIDLTGILLILVTAVGYSVQLVISQWYLRDYDPRTVTFYIVGSMTLVILGIWLGQGAEWHNPGLTGWMGIAWLGAIGTFLARLSMFAAVQKIGSGQTALLASPETMLTILWSTMFLDETLTVIQWLGSGLIIVSALLAIKRMQRAKPPIWRTWLRL